MYPTVDCLPWTWRFLHWPGSLHSPATYPLGDIKAPTAFSLCGPSLSYKSPDQKAELYSSGHLLRARKTEPHGGWGVLEISAEQISAKASVVGTFWNVPQVHIRRWALLPHEVSDPTPRWLVEQHRKHLSAQMSPLFLGPPVAWETSPCC